MTVGDAQPAPVPLAPEKAESMRGDVNQNPPGMGLLALLREDRRTHDGRWLEQGCWAVAVHRFGNWRMSVRPRLVRLPLSLLYKFLEKWVEWTCGITLPYTVKLGRRVRIWHHGGMILHAESIGDDVHVRQNTTFGVARRDSLHQLPVIEERVDIGCGAVLVGAIRIGHDSMIGANSVVTKDVPPFSVAVGAPAKVVKELPAAGPAAPPVHGGAGHKLKVASFIVALVVTGLMALALPVLMTIAAIRMLIG